MEWDFRQLNALCTWMVCQLMDLTISQWGSCFIMDFQGLVLPWFLWSTFLHPENDSSVPCLRDSIFFFYFCIKNITNVMLDPLFIVSRTALKILVRLSSHMELKVLFRVHSDGWKNLFHCSWTSEALGSQGCLFPWAINTRTVYFRASRTASQNFRESLSPLW